MLKWLEMWGNLSMIQNEKKHVPIKSTCGFLAKAVREFYSNLADVKNDDPRFNRALKLCFAMF